MRMSLLPNCSMATRSHSNSTAPIRLSVSPKKGILAAANFSRLDVASDLDLSDADRDSLEDADDIPEPVAEALADNEQRNALIIQSILDLSRRHNRILVYAASVRNALLLARRAASHGS